MNGAQRYKTLSAIDKCVRAIRLSRPCIRINRVFLDVASPHAITCIQVKQEESVPLIIVGMLQSLPRNFHVTAMHANDLQLWHTPPRNYLVMEKSALEVRTIIA